MNLEHFVLFSSMAAMLCPIGQSNHAAANMFLDSLAYRRHSLGLPAQTINWGAWSEVGAATNSNYGNYEGMYGVKPFSPSQGIATLKFMMNRPNLVQLGVIQMDVSVFKQSNVFNSGIVSLIEDEIDGESQMQSAAQSEKFISEISNLSFDERIAYFKSRLETIIRKTLKLSEGDVIDEHQQFSEIGLDSLMAVEMKNKLQLIVGKTITLNATSLLDYPTVYGLSKYLAESTMAIDTKPSAVAVEIPAKVKINTEDLVKKDSILPLDIKIISQTTENEIRNILLTGATGQIGCYILRDLLQNPDLKIYCLIRGKNQAHAIKKLRATLKKYQLTNEVNIDQIKFVVGNITEDRLGLSGPEYKELSENISCVFHFAAKVSHVETYQVTKSNVDIRSVNVFGTVNILRFCSAIKTKHLVFASSYPAINRLTPDGFASEEFPDSENYGDGITEGYFLSKFVGEKLVKEAISRGMPCTSIRYPVIVGNSETGHFTVETNLLMNLALVSSQMGIFPDIKGGLNCLPVDIASKLTMELIFNKNSTPGMYNLLHTCPMYSKDIVNAAVDTGYDMTLATEDEYFTEFEKESEANSFLALFTEQYGKDLKSAIFNFSDTLKMSLLNEKIIYRFSNRLLKVIPDIEIPNNHDVLKLYFKYARRSGIAEKFLLAKF